MVEFDKLKAIFDLCQEDVDKVERGNRAAGTRLRKKMQDLKKAAQEVRAAVLAKKDTAE